MRSRLAPLLALLSASLGAACSTSPRAGRDVAGGGPAAPEPGAAVPDAPSPASASPSAAPKGKPILSRKARRSVEEDDAFYAEKLATARDCAAKGEDVAALELVAAALKLDPPAPWDGRLKSLRMEVKARRLDEDVVRADVRGEKDYVPFDADVYLVVRIRNLGASDVVIRPPGGAGPDATSGSAFVLSITRRDRDIYATELSRTWTQVVPLVTAATGELRIPPESAHEVRVRMPAEDVGQAISGVRVLEVGGILRAGRIETSLGEPLGSVPIRTGRVVVLPGNFEPLAADPIGSLGKAVTAIAPVHVVVAAEFVPAAARPQAMAVLARALSTGPQALRPACLNAVRTIRRAAAGTPLRPLAAPLMDALAAQPDRAPDVMEGLSVLTGATFAPDARLWQEWWRREVQGPGAPVPDEEAASGGRAPKIRPHPKPR